MSRRRCRKVSQPAQPGLGQQAGTAGRDRCTQPEAPALLTVPPDRATIIGSGRASWPSWNGCADVKRTARTACGRKPLIGSAWPGRPGHYYWQSGRAGLGATINTPVGLVTLCRRRWLCRYWWCWSPLLAVRANRKVAVGAAGRRYWQNEPTLPGRYYRQCAPGRNDAALADDSACGEARRGGLARPLLAPGKVARRSAAPAA